MNVENMHGEKIKTLKFVHKMSAEIIKFVAAVHNWFVKRGG